MSGPTHNASHPAPDRSLILELQAGEASRRRAAIDTVVEQWQGPVYAWFRQKGFGAEQAADLVRGFFVEKVLDGELFARVDPRRAKLRVLLRTALNRFGIEDYRRRRLRRSGVSVSPDRLAREEEIFSRATPGLADAFQQRWVSLVLEEAMRRCRERFLEQGREREWNAFYAQSVKPLVSGVGSPSTTQVAAEVGLLDKGAVTEASDEIRRGLRGFLLEVVGETVGDLRLAEEELRELLATM